MKLSALLPAFFQATSCTYCVVYSHSQLCDDDDEYVEDEYQSGFLKLFVYPISFLISRAVLSAPLLQVQLVWIMELPTGLNN
jgi:hypothetical protein